MTTIKTKKTTTKKGATTVEDEEYDIPEELVDLALTIVASGEKVDMGARLDAIAKEVAQLYCDSWEYRDTQVAQARARRAYRRMGLKHWSEDNEP